jgi:hypothetical protein
MPKLLANERGIWFENESTGIAWDEVFSLSGSKLDGVTETYICLILDFEYGEFVELYDNWPGFQDVIESITHRLPGIGPNWFQQVKALTTEDPPLEIWHR